MASRIEQNLRLSEYVVPDCVDIGLLAGILVAVVDTVDEPSHVTVLLRPDYQGDVGILP